MVISYRTALMGLTVKAVRLLLAFGFTAQRINRIFD